MKKLLICLVTSGVASVAGCNRPPATPNPIVGTWFVDDVAAPFRYHMYVFNADGTMQQANPDAGDEHTSDSDGKGVWISDGGRIKGKWVEIQADRTTHRFTGTTQLRFDVKVDHDHFTGTETPAFFDPQGTQTGSKPATALDGKRVTLP